MTGKEEIISHSADDTFNAGRKFAEKLRRGSIAGLFGDLGSGKTMFVKGICSYFNVKDCISSPTFIIVNEYKGIDKVTGTDLDIFHFDLYRVKNLKELMNAGFENYINGSSICLIEWAEIAKEFLKDDMINVNFSHGKNETERIIKY